MEHVECNVLVLGGGPGGYVAAIRAGQLGLDTVLVEQGALGGTCLNVGCIPSKALIHAAEQFATLTSAANGDSSVPGMTVSGLQLDYAKTIDWKNGIVTRLNSGVGHLLKRAGVRVVQGHGAMVDGKHCRVDAADGAVTIAAKNVILATGSAPVSLPGMPFSDDVISSTDALALTEVPEKLAVVGGGYIGLELGMAFARLGSTVTVIEAESQILAQYDAQLVAPVERALKTLDVTVLTDAKAKDVSGHTLTVDTGHGNESRVDFDKLLITVGRAPVTSGWGLEELALDMEGPFVKVDQRCRTSMTRVYAVGDLTGEPMLAHRAMAQGDVAARVIAEQDRVFDPVSIPAVVFTDPEIVTAGITVADAESASLDVAVTEFPLAANGRAMTLHAEDGLMRIISRPGDDVILGLAATGRHVSELASAFTIALEMGACVQDIAAIIQAHPTQAESFQEAALKALGEGLHL